jgi:transposase
VQSATPDTEGMLRTLAELGSELETLRKERDEYRKLYLGMLELCRKLERGILGQKRERFTDSEPQLTMEMLGMLAGKGATSESASPAIEEVRAHTREKPTGRKPLPEKLPRVEITVLPPEVEKAGLDAFEVIGEDVTETVERRPASLVVVRTRKPKFVVKNRDRLDDTEVLQGSTPELPIGRGLAGPALLADTIVRRWQDHLPLHRLERVYGRDGLELARSTICGWHQTLSELVRPLIDAMWADAFTSPYLCIDATGVLVQALEKCRNGHFWVTVAPEKHALFSYSSEHNGAAVDELVKGYKGYLVSDAHSVYEHLYRTGDIIKSGCIAHCRRYYWKSLSTDPERARHALTLLGRLFQIEREAASLPSEQRRVVRQRDSAPILKNFFGWCDEQAPLVLDETPISKAIGYARNQRVALQRFLDDGRLPMHNNISERALRREALGRRNWLFLGTDEAGDVNATFVTLLASCEMHGIEPLGYLRDLLCLLPSWPAKRILELAPAYWKKTLEHEEAQQRLAANVFRQVSLGALVEHRANK